MQEKGVTPQPLSRQAFRAVAPLPQGVDFRECKMESTSGPQALRRSIPPGLLLVKRMA